MSIQKTFFPEKGVCRVMFKVPESLVDHIRKVALVGDFNDWHPEKNPMKVTDNGNFVFTIELPVGRNYQFRYFIDNYRWESDKEADDLIPTPYEDAI